MIALWRQDYPEGAVRRLLVGGPRPVTAAVGRQQVVGATRRALLGDVRPRGWPRSWLACVGFWLLEALVEQLLARVAELETALAQRDQRIAELERRFTADSSNSSRPPSSDAPWEKNPAKKRSSRGRSGRKLGKQPGASSVSRSLTDDPDDVIVIELDRCHGYDASLVDAAATGRDRRQVVDVAPAPALEVIEYQRVSRRCRGCGQVTTPGWDTLATEDPRRDVLAGPGSPVRIGPEAVARAALLTCGHYLPIGRARDLLRALTGIDVSTGLLAGVRGRAARNWRSGSWRMCRRCWSPRRCCTRMRPPAARQGRCRMCTSRAPSA